MSVVRINHTSSFTTLTNSTIWDKDLSLAAVGLLTRLLSRPPNWDFHVSELAESCGCSAGFIRKTFKQLIELGYMERQTKPRGEGQQFNGVEYTIYEEKQVGLKKCSPRDVSPHAVPPRSVECSLIKTETKKDELDKRSPVSSSKKTEPPICPGVMDLANYLLSRIREKDGKFRQPRIEKWARDIQPLISKHGFSHQEVCDVIDWAIKESFWCKQILSGHSLEKQFDKLRFAMLHGETQAAASETRDFARSHIKSYSSTYRTAKFLPDGIQNTNTGEIVPYNIPLAEFSQRLPDAFMTANGYAR